MTRGVSSRSGAARAVGVDGAEDAEAVGSAGGVVVGMAQGVEEEEVGREEEEEEKEPLRARKLRREPVLDFILCCFDFLGGRNR
jgi:hypothetical protein